TQGLPCAADLSRNRDDRRPLRLVFPLMLEHHPNSPSTELRRILCCCFHDSILSRIGVSGNPGAVHVGLSWRRGSGQKAPALSSASTFLEIRPSAILMKLYV